MVDNKQLVFQFIEEINLQRVKNILALSDDDFRFVDTHGIVHSKKDMETGWSGYFAWFPDYHISITDYIENEKMAVVLGQASGSYLGNENRHWQFPAAWKIEIENNKIILWQVFCDSKMQLDSMN